MPCFLSLTGATWYYHAIYIVFASYRYDILEVTFNLDAQRSKFGNFFYKFGRQSLKKT